MPTNQLLLKNLVKNQALLKTQAFINGQWVSANSGKAFPVLNPANGVSLASVPDMGAEETEDAIKAANDALGLWRSTTAKARSQLLRRWFELIMENQEDLAVLMTAEQGKPLAETRGEVAYGASFVEWFAEEGKRTYGSIVPTHMNDRRLLVLKQPIGVCALITPWNFPNAMITRKAAPAMAAGCTVVIKPAEATPLSALALAVLAQEAGIPDGVFNVVTTMSPAAVGDSFCKSDIVRKLSFTGSTAVGKKLFQDCSGTVKKLSLELGGNAPFIVFEDADLDLAVAGAMASKYRNSGQTCVCANRFLVSDKIHDEFVQKLAQAVKSLHVGDGLQDDIHQGPLINEAAVNKVELLLDDAIKQGANVVIGGSRHALGGTFFQPTVVAGITNTMRFATEEIFGPVAPIFKFSSEQEAVAMANDTEYGLAAYFYTQDRSRVWRVSEALEYGMVGINEGILSTESAPFGGVKASGIGREGAKEGIDEYIELKYLCMGGLDE